MLAAAESMELGNEKQSAYEMYQLAFGALKKASTREEILRATAVAGKLAEMAQELGQAQEEEKKWLMEAAARVGAVLVLDRKENQKQLEHLEEQLRQLEENGTSNGNEWDYNHRKILRMEDMEVPNTLGELEVPKWAEAVDVLAPFEALGSFYARTGNIGYVALFFVGRAHLNSDCRQGS